MKILSMLLLMVLAVPSAATPNVDPRASALLDKAANSYGALNGLEMSIARSYSPDAKSNVRTVEVAFQRPNLMRTREKYDESQILLVSNNQQFVVSDGKSRASLFPPLGAAQVAKRVGESSGLGEAVYVDQGLLGALLQGKNPLRGRLTPGPDVVFREARFLSARNVEGRACEGIVWRQRVAGMVDSPLNVEWTAWFDKRNMRMLRVQTRVLFDRLPTPYITVHRVQSRDNPTFAPDYFQWTALPEMKITDYKSYAQPRK